MYSLEPRLPFQWDCQPSEKPSTFVVKKASIQGSCSNETASCSVVKKALLLRSNDEAPVQMRLLAVQSTEKVSTFGVKKTNLETRIPFKWGCKTKQLTKKDSYFEVKWRAGSKWENNWPQPLGLGLGGREKKNSFDNQSLDSSKLFW